MALDASKDTRLSSGVQASTLTATLQCSRPQLSPHTPVVTPILLLRETTPNRVRVEAGSLLRTRAHTNNRVRRLKLRRPLPC